MTVRAHRRSSAFTLVELLVVLALAAIIITLAAPSLRDMILAQRLRGINAQLVTDVIYARSEAVSRAAFVQVRFQNTSGSSGMSCYILYTRPDGAFTPTCDCTAAEGSRCTDASLREVKTVQIPNSQSVTVEVPSGASMYVIDPRTGSLKPSSAGQSGEQVLVDSFIDGTRKFRNHLGQSGRPSVCIPSGSKLDGTPCT